MTIKTPSGNQLAKDMRAFAEQRKQSGRAVTAGQQPFNTLTADQLRQLFCPDEADATPTPVSRAALATQFKLAPATLDLLLAHYSGITIWTDERGQMHGRDSRAR